jgi:hypothetical protein
MTMPTQEQAQNYTEPVDLRARIILNGDGVAVLEPDRGSSSPPMNPRLVELGRSLCHE